MVIDSKNKSSFKLKGTFKESFSSYSKNTDSLIARKKIKETDLSADRQGDKTTGMEVDDGKRLFLKIAGAAGLGLAASSLFPNRTGAYIAGSSPTSSTVAIKNIANQKINPATEDTVATLATETTLGSVKTGTDNLAGIKTGTDNLAAIKTSTDHLANIETNTGKFSFDTDSNLKISATTTVSAGNVNLQDTTGVRINPASDDSLVYLRRMVKLMESQGTVDAANRQRVTIDGTVTTSASTTITALAGQNQQIYQDPARTAYAVGIRNNLAFS
jgi:hypothetical protein